MAIWLIGGTSESVTIAKALTAVSLPCMVTVTTENAQRLYPQTPYLSIKVGQLTEKAIAYFAQSESITVIVDASHPYATAISQLALSWAQENNIPYLRFERPSVEHKTAQELDSFETLTQGDYLLGQRVLLTIGYKTLPLFQPWQAKATLFTRLLPVVNSLKVAIASGFTSDRIIAIRPPINAELEKAIWKYWNISLVVTKASGEAGGEAVKQRVADELKIPLIVIARPKINYFRQTSDIAEVISFCCQYLGTTYV